MLENQSSGLRARKVRVRRSGHEKVLERYKAGSASRERDWHCSLRWRSGGKDSGPGNSGSH